MSKYDEELSPKEYYYQGIEKIKEQRVRELARQTQKVELATDFDYSFEKDNLLSSHALLERIINLERRLDQSQ